MTKYLRNDIENITKDIRSNYTYVEDPPWLNKSNRLEKIERNGNKYFDLSGEYSYDPDGNFSSLTRIYNSDNFLYDYYSGTNRLKKVSGTTDQYTYDYNGNQTNDYFNNNTGISYDHRNLITEITRSDNTTDPPTTIKIRYKYDEAGNRTRKTIYQTQDENPSPITNGDNPTGWTITKDEYYSRDASGKEIAVYQSYNLDYWNVWGAGNEGRIKPTGMKYYYLKDHLGSIRAVINQNNVLVQAQDYDPWGHIARTWDSTSANYKFTGKERDQESSYDYFGARYYDSRVGNWLTTDPLFEKRIVYSPYNYVLRNTLILIDPDGRIDVPEAYKNQYPKLYSYMENSFEKNVTNDKKIMDAFKVTGMSEDKIKENLKFGQGPIKLEILDLGYNDGNQKRLGHWDVTTQTIQLDPFYVKLLEESNGDALKVYSFLVQAIILHEGAHAAQDLSGNSNSSDIDIGYIFEMKAYYNIIPDSYNKAANIMNWRNYYLGKSKRFENIENGN